MRKKTKSSIKAILIILTLGIGIFSGGYFYLNSKLNEITVNDQINSVPYYTQIPENCCLLLNICEDRIILDLNFEEERLNIVFAEHSADSYGYDTDYNINCDYKIVGYLVDIVGGIELENLRYTGVQIVDILEYSYQTNDVKKQICQQIINGIGNSGFTKENLLYIIENSETELKFNKCFLWTGYIGTLCKYPNFVN